MSLELTIASLRQVALRQAVLEHLKIGAVRGSFRRERRDPVSLAEMRDVIERLEILARRRTSRRDRGG